MLIGVAGKRICTEGIFAVCAIVALVAMIAAGPVASAQDPVRVVPLGVNLGPPASCPQPAALPNVPLQAQRPAEGAAADQRWQFELGGAPTATLMHPLTRNDAAVEVIVGQARLLPLKADLANERGLGVISVGDPTVLEFEVMPNPRLIRLLGNRAGVTDLSVVLADQQTVCLEVRVVYDLPLLQAQLKQLFPDAQLHLFQIREHLAVEGEARSVRQVDQILQTIEAYLVSVQVPSSVKGKETPDAGRSGAAGGGRAGPQAPPPENQAPAGAAPAVEGAAPPTGEPGSPEPPGQATPEPGSRPESVEATLAAPRIINLLRVPGVHQVMLQVRIAELNRTGLREIGADMNLEFGPGNILETFLIPAGSQTVHGVFPTTDLELWIRALRNNTLLSVLAEPNLVALSGQRADFLAGGEFPVPVPQNSGGGTTITVEFKKYGVQLEFTPFVLEDETIRLTVNSEESSPDYSQAVLINDYNVPGINTRRASTTVEMRQGQSLAVAGLLRVSIDADTKRIPGLGDLPYLGPLFSNTTHKRQEKELLILVTPYLVAPMNAENVPCLPGEELKDPNDWEFYLLNRIEGRTGREWSSAREWDDPWHLRQLMHLEQSGISGPVGLSPCE
ncbi:MAG TPA: pilus assembly protein N-terminal domain-containing protein [Candidatus Anammoximicrobium sp.]|nr:pilus assembly protein N-terminal domain-containing protein [Candidatus Anammoximicrobium sp.]